MNPAELSRFVDPNGRCIDPRWINAIAAFCNVASASYEEIASAREIAARAIPDGVVTVERMQAVQAITKASIFVAREEGAVVGMTAFFPLRASGMAALQSGQFDTLEPDLNHICPPREAPAGGYAWGFIGLNDKAAGRVVKACVAVRETLCWALPIYTRAATEAGAKVIFGPLGFRPVPGDATLAFSEGHKRPMQGLIAQASTP